MPKSIKLLVVVLIILLGLTSALAGFFYAKTIKLSKKSVTDSGTKKITDKATTDTTKEAEKQSESSGSTSKDTSNAVTAASSQTNRPSNPSDTVTVKAGQTLFAIGQEVGVSWTQIASANGIDADKIQEGQVLVVPKNNQVSYTVNQEKAKDLQSDVDGGKYAFRLSPIETAKSDAPTIYGLTVEDVYTQTKIDEASGTCTLMATHGDVNYQIKLIQPVTKGEKGIWAIESVKPAN